PCTSSGSPADAASVTAAAIAASLSMAAVTVHPQAEPTRASCRQLSVRKPRPGKLRSRGLSQREHLARVQQPARIEGGLDAPLLRQLLLGELHRHQVALLHAHAMLPGKAAADFHAQLEDVGAERLRP